MSKMAVEVNVWQGAELSKRYLEGVRGAIPLAAEQIEVMLRVIQAGRPQLGRFLDLGCGDGILGRAILARYPEARGIFLDFSEPMLQAAQERCAASGKPGRLEFILKDYGQPDWVEAIQHTAPFDVVVSGFSIHHQPDAKKQELYQEIYHLLTPGGFFLNLEHVSSSTPWLEKVADEMFIDSLYQFHQENGSHKPREIIAQEFYNRPDKAANILAPVELQCDWLRQLGFIHVDCYLKVFELALFGGMRPPISPA